MLPQKAIEEALRCSVVRISSAILLSRLGASRPPSPPVPAFTGTVTSLCPGEDGARPTRPLSTKLPHSGRHRCELGDRWVQRTKWMPRSAATDRAWISMSLTNLLKRSLTATTSLLEIRSPFSGQSHLSLSEPMLPVASDNAETTALSSPLRSRSIRPDSPGAVALSP